MPPSYFTVDAADQISQSGVPGTLTRSAAVDLANQALIAVQGTSQLVPSGCLVEIVAGPGVKLTMGANPRTFSPEELDGLIYNLQQARMQV